MNPTADRVVLFHRDFQGLSGGHLKVWHYFLHARHSQRFQPRIYFTPQSLHGPGNPWHGISPPPLANWRPQDAAVLFVAGLDWEALPDPAPAPVINLIQGVRHGDARDPRRGFLSRPAIRICVSDEVAAAIVSTGLVNGPVHVIPNGIDLGDLPTSNRRFASGRRPRWLRPAYSGASASLSRPWPAHRLGRARPGPLSTGRSFRRHPSSCPTSTSTASDGIPCHGADGQ